MKQRLLVMNGQRIVQTEQEGAWANQKVDKAGALKPGIYNLYMAQQADKKQTHDGVIVHADNNQVYQQVGKTRPKGERVLVCYDCCHPADGPKNEFVHLDHGSSSL